MDRQVKETNKVKAKLIFAMLIWGTMGIFVRGVDKSSIDIAFYRALIGWGFITIISIAKRDKYDVNLIAKNLKVLIPSGIVLGLGWGILFQGYNNTTISNAILSYYIAPIIVVILSFLLLKEKITLKKILCVLVSMIGLILIVNTSDAGSSEYNHKLGIAYSMMAGVCYAIVIILNKFIKDLPGSIVTIIQLFISAIVLLPIVLLNGNFEVGSTDLKSIICLIIIGVFHTGLAYQLYFSAVKELEGQTIAVLSYIDPIFAVFTSFVFLKESMTIIQIIGGTLIIGSAFVSEYKKKVSSD